MSIKIKNLGEAWEQPAVSSLLRSPGFIQTDGMDADAFVCWGLRPPYEAIVKELREAGRPVIVLDSGYMKRSQYGRAAQTSDYYALSLSTILNPAPTASALARVLTDEFLCDRRDVMDEYLVNGNASLYQPATVVILGQTVGDRSHGLSREQMLERYCEIASMHAESDVLFRPHPQDGEIAPDMVDSASILDGQEPLIPQLYRLGGPGKVLVATISSNAGLEAKLQGYEVDADSAWYRSMNNFDAFDTACDSQFNCPELEAFGYSLVRSILGK